MELVKQVILRLKLKKENTFPESEKIIGGEKIIPTNDEIIMKAEDKPEKNFDGEDWAAKEEIDANIEQEVLGTSCHEDATSQDEISIKVENLTSEQHNVDSMAIKEEVNNEIIEGSCINETIKMITCSENTLTNRINMDNIEIIEEGIETGELEEPVHVKADVENDSEINILRDENTGFNTVSIVRVNSLGESIGDIENMYNVDLEQNGNYNEIVDRNLDADITTEDNISDTKHDDAEYLISTLNPEEKLNIDQFEKIVHELNSVQSPDISDIEDVLEPHMVVKKAYDTKDNLNVDLQGEDIGNKSSNVVNESIDDDVICISSDDENDLKLSLSTNEIEDVSLSPIQSFEDNDVVILETEESEETLVKYILLDKDVENDENNKTVVETEGRDEIDGIISLDSPVHMKTTKEFNNKELDTISINSNSSDGYTSSDFEFITEEEAKAATITDFEQVNQMNKRIKPIVANKNRLNKSITPKGRANTLRNTIRIRDTPGPSWQRNYENVASPRLVIDYTYRRNHEIPQGNRYLQLFGGYYAPTTPYMFENKSMSSHLIGAPYAGLGFDVRLMPRQDREENDEEMQFKNEADETAKKILEMYPGENRKRRRRF